MIVIAKVFVYVEGVAWTKVLAIGTKRINGGNIIIEESVSSGFSFQHYCGINQSPSC